MGSSRTESQLCECQNPLDLTTSRALPAMAERAQNAQVNAGEEESLMNTVWGIAQKMFLAWAVSQLGMQNALKAVFLRLLMTTKSACATMGT